MSHRFSSIRRRFVLVVAVIAAGATLSHLGFADDKAVGEKAVGNKTADDKAVKEPPKGAAKNERSAAKAHAVGPIDPEREAAALTFARENHPELAALLDGLKKNAPREYQAALVDLDRAVERLARFKDKTPDRYQFEVTEWKMTSRIRLLAARLSMSEDPTVEAELRSALRERLELRLAAQRSERDRLRTRVTRLDQQIDEMSSKTDATIEKQFAELRKTLPATRPTAKMKAKKPAQLPADVKGEQK